MVRIKVRRKEGSLIDKVKTAAGERGTYTLYGDGIHDDYPAIQQMLDSGKCEISLPAPDVCYLISRTLEIPSYTRLVLPRYAEIRLADGANCPMIQNKTIPVPDYKVKGELWDIIWSKSADKQDCVHDFEISGGIWNCNNRGQAENPIWTAGSGPEGYSGFGMLFVNVENFKLTNMTLKDPVNFAVTLDTASWFTVEDITFDFNYGNPTAVNMDGIHLNGNCHYGTIRNLKGSCYDDLVALNADEGTDGPITNIEISGIYSTDCHSAVRLLTVKNPVEKIHISDVYGTFYQYGIGVTKFYPGKTTGYYDALTFDNIYASKAERLDLYCKAGSYVYPLIYIQEETVVKNLKIHALHRREFMTPVETVYVGADSVVDSLILENITNENHTDEPMPFLVNNGIIKNLVWKEIRVGNQPLMTGSGTVERVN
ncbi:MAG: hypothetical protein IKC46_09320 [Lachnospiraceae bacterium]|nr:hypothetical protein [Lachnospiraceae bacterium]